MAASKHIPKYYPGDTVWCICYDENDKAYAAEKIVLSIEIWPSEGVLYNLVDPDCWETHMKMLEEDRIQGLIVPPMWMYTKEEAEKEVERQNEERSHQ